MCQTRSMYEIPDNFVTCARELDLDDAAIRWCVTMSVGDDVLIPRRCAEDEDGRHLMAKSVQYIQSLGVKKSCTIRLQHESYCIRDGGIFHKGCKGPRVDLLIRDVCDKYAEMHSDHSTGELPTDCILSAEELKAKYANAN